MIDLERWNEIKEIVQAALDLQEEERSEYLETACKGDQELRRQVEVLLAVSATHADFYDDLQLLPPGLRKVTLREGDRVGTYIVVRPLGQGGMGAVYLAEDTRHDRQVALKILPTSSDQVSMHEQRALARLQHPSIASFYDSGQTKDGFAYFVMEFVEGEPITTYCETRRLTVNERLTLFCTLCDAVSYAHRNLVVHRDIKPANILVTPEAKLKLLDFGIAKFLSPDLSGQEVTEPEKRSLTLAFASPEQLSGEVTSTSTDIYSLGVLLCLLLSGRLPYPVKSYHDLPWAVRNMEPEKPSQLVFKHEEQTQESDDHLASSLVARGGRRRLARVLSGDLDAIVLRALRKEPDRRYQTVSDLAEDTRRHISREPVSARKGSRRYRAGKFIQRHRVAVSAVAFAVTLMLCLIMGLLVQLNETSRQRKIASENAEQTRTSLQFLTDLFDRADSWSVGGSPQSPEQFIDGAVDRLNLDFQDQPQVRARLLTVLGGIHTRLSRFERAASLLQEALKIQEGVLEPTHIDIGDTLNVLGALRLKEGSFDEAERSLSRSLAIARVHAREKPASVASRLSNLSSLMVDRDRPHEAEALAREALAICEVNPAETCREALDNILHHLAQALRAQDRFEEALNVVQQALTLRMENYPASHPSIATSLQTLASLYHDMGDHVREEEEARKALAIMEASLPPENPDHLANKSSVAGALAHLGRYRESEELYREVLEVSRRVLPPQHKGLGSAINNVAYSMFKQKMVKEALPLFLEALLITKRARGPESRHVAIMLDNIGSCQVQLGQFDEAEGTYREAVRVSRIAFGSQTVGTALTLKSHGKAKLIQSNFEEARRLFQEAAEVFRLKYPASHPQLAHTQALVGASLLKLGELGEAERLLLDAYRTLDENEVGDRSFTAETLKHLIVLYQERGRADEVQKYERLLEIEGTSPGT